MNNFDFQNTTRIVFGKGSIGKLGTLVPEGVAVVMVFGGGSIRENGVYDAVKAALGDRIVMELGGIPANPEYEILMEMVGKIAPLEKPFLLSVGGGSVLDGVKFIAAAALWEGEPWDILRRDLSPERALPLGAVLTLPATGSEANGNSVVSRRSTGEKLSFWSRAVYPAFSVLDPETTFTLPLRQTANGIVDTWVHVCEQYLTVDNASPVTDRIAEGILLTLKEYGPAVLKAPRDYDLRAGIMWASTMALNGTLGCGTVQDWATHMIGHELTALHGLDHAQTLAIVLPGVLQYKKEAKFDKLLQYARRVWGLHQGDERVLVDEAIARTILFFESLGVGTRLRDYGIGVEAAEAVEANLARRGAVGGEDRDIDAAAARVIVASRA